MPATCSLMIVVKTSRSYAALATCLPAYTRPSRRLSTPSTRAFALGSGRHSSPFSLWSTMLSSAMDMKASLTSLNEPFAYL